MLAEFEVHESTQPFSDLRQQSKGIFPRSDVFEVLVEYLLGTTFELSIRQRIFDGYEGATKLIF